MVASQQVQKRKKNKKWMYVGLFFVLPSVIFTLIFDYYPLLNGVYHAFYRWDGVSIEKFIGITNFVEILSDKVFWVSVQNMLFFLACNIVLMTPTIVACIVMHRIRSRGVQYFYRILFCVPMIIPGMVMMLLWQFMYNPQFGFFNQFLTLIGLEQYKQLWLGDPRIAKFCLVFMGFPWVGTTGALIYLGGLQSIDTSIWDAAALDGVGPIRRAFSLELPLIMGQIKLTLIGVFTGSITGYGAQLIMTNGGPGFSTLVPGLYMYSKAFGQKADFGYASAVGLLLFMIALGLSMFTMKFLRSDRT